MVRPDEKLFLQHAEHFEAIDEYLEEFCRINGFEMDKNLHHTPCRVLRKLGNPRLLMDLYQEGNWRELDYRENLPHTFAVGGYYLPTSDSDFAQKLERVIVQERTFREISENLTSLVSLGLSIVDSWTPESFMVDGVPVKNLRKKLD